MNKIETLTLEQLNQLRREIVLDSVFVSDYDNTLGLDANEVCNFFGGYCEYLWEIAEEREIKNLSFFEIVKLFDNSKNLENWWLCYVGIQAVNYEIH